MSPDVSVVIVVHQNRAHIGRALAGLGGHDGVPHEVIVVDNASTDGAAEEVATRHPDIRVVRLARNVGFGRAVNAGAGLARARWLLLLNPDAEPVGDLLGALVRFARRNPEHRIYAGRTLGPDGADDGRSVFGLPTLRSYACFATGLSTAFRRVPALNPEALPGLDRSRPAVVPAASGCVLLVDRALFAELGGFTPDYFMYSEDVDLCLRAAGRGARPVLVPAARVTHLGGGSSTGVGKRVMVLRGRVTYLRLHWTPRRAAAGRALLAAGVAVRALGARLTGRAGYWPAVWAQRRVWLAGWPPPDADEPAASPGPPDAPPPPGQSGSSPAVGTGPGTDRSPNEATV
ncbi:glycosyltransferase family 2 protein [Plantactinospora sp. GCM10030261]|uniref:glycosyltransferase family 2 protein n=1 Tax=Plantactinospora sp. GCM10030261 TaxID=3273420 RepID=UPI003605EDCB